MFRKNVCNEESNNVSSTSRICGESKRAHLDRHLNTVDVKPVRFRRSKFDSSFNRQLEYFRFVTRRPRSSINCNPNLPQESIEGDESCSLDSRTRDVEVGRMSNVRKVLKEVDEVASLNVSAGSRIEVEL